jgi:hypothetical protein
MATNGQRPKLEPELNQEVRVRLLKDKPYSGENGFGKYYLYAVQDVSDGEEKAFFAPDYLHQQIEEMKLTKGSEFVLRKIPYQNGNKKITSKLKITIVSTPPAFLDHYSSAGDTVTETMEQSLRDAVEMTKRIEGIPWRSEDIQRVAVTLFISRTR